ncbi:hypothetical protein NMG60_11001722 [Bertholletia excelsa]
MASNSNSKQKTSLQCPVFQPADYDDDFRDAGVPLRFLKQISGVGHDKNLSYSKGNIAFPEKPSRSSRQGSRPRPLKPSNSASVSYQSQRPKTSTIAAGKENHNFSYSTPEDVCFTTIDDSSHQLQGLSSNASDDCGLDSINSTIDCVSSLISSCRNPPDSTILKGSAPGEISDDKGLNLNQRRGRTSNSLEARLITSIINPGVCDSGSDDSLDNGDKSEFEFESCTQLDMLLNLCSEANGDDDISNEKGFDRYAESIFRSSPIHCPLCGTDISDLSNDLRQTHTNDCLDKEEASNVVRLIGEVEPQCPGQVFDGSPVKSPPKIAPFSPVSKWLHGLGLARYEQMFVQEEIDWDTLQWLREEDLVRIGVTALGPRKKIVNALGELRKESTKATVTRTCEIRKESTQTNVIRAKASRDDTEETSGLAVNRLITDYFPCSGGLRKKKCSLSGQCELGKGQSSSGHKQTVAKKTAMTRKLRDVPQWCCVPGTPFRVDAFKYLRRDCSHWFLTHFHADHYQGLTRFFCYGKIYCSDITARLVNMKIGIPWDKLQVLSLKEKINIAGIDVTCFDANHCPGSIIVLFEPPNGKAVLHTGDFRFCEEMANIPALQMQSIHTLILDTTYCNPQYDFPKQEAVIQFVIEAIQAETFNSKTLFLIGSYTIGKERLFLEVARVLQKKVYVTAAKLRVLECLGLSKEDMQWLTLNGQESNIHVVPLWMLASFKRLKCISNQYANRFKLIVAFSPTGWTFGKGKKKSPGRRWQQGTIVRYEVPYSEHSSFTELREFVKFVSPEIIIPSVNNNGPQSANQMVSLLL